MELRTKYFYLDRMPRGFLEYDKEHPNDYEPIRAEIESRQSSQSLTGLSGELNEKKKELPENISQREFI